VPESVRLGSFVKFMTIDKNLVRPSIICSQCDLPQAVEVLCHEWAHVMAWNFAVDRLINAPDTAPVEFERACHDEAWGCAYSRVWRAYLDVIRDAA